jgi:hypothetical protein
VRDTVLCICELGWLYGRVAAYLKDIFALATDSRGVVVQAFGFALQVEEAEPGLCSFNASVVLLRFCCMFYLSECS